MRSEVQQARGELMQKQQEALDANSEMYSRKLQ